MAYDSTSTKRARLLKSAVPVALGYALATILALRHLLFSPGLVGRHWDWAIPRTSASLRTMASLQGNAWFPTALGSYVRFRYGGAPGLFLIGSLGYFGLSGEQAGKVLLALASLSAGLGMYLFAGTVLRFTEPIASPRIPAFLAGLLYMLSPFHYSQIIAGDALGLLAYAAAPFAATQLLRAVARADRREWHAVWSGILFAFTAGCSLQTFLLTIAVVIPFVILTAPNMSRAIYAGAWTIISFALSAGYWLLPAFLSRTTGSELTSTTGSTDIILRIVSRFSSLGHAVAGASYWSPFYTDALPASLVRPWLISVALGMGVWIVLSAILPGPRKSLRRIALFWVVAYFLGVILSAPASPVGWPVRFLFENMELWRLLFRTPQHLVFLVAFVAPLVLALGLVTIQGPTSRLRMSQAVMPLVGVLFVAIVALGYVARADFQGYVGPHPAEAGESAVSNILQRDRDHDGRLLSYPGGISKLFTSDAVRSLSEEAGDDADTIWGPHPLLASEQKWSPYPESRSLQRMVYTTLIEDPRSARPLLNLTGVKYVVLTPFYGPGAGAYYGRWDQDQGRASLNRAGYLREIFWDGRWSLWENTGYTSSRIQLTQRYAFAGAAQPFGSAIATAPLGEERREWPIIVQGEGDHARREVIAITPPTRPLSEGVAVGLTHMPLLNNTNAHAQESGQGHSTTLTLTAKRQGELIATFHLPTAARSALDSPSTSVITFEGRSTLQGSVTIWLQTMAGSRYEWRLDLPSVWSRQNIPLASLVPVGDVAYSDVSLLRVAAADMVGRGATIQLRGLALHRSPGTPERSLEMRGWFVEAHTHSSFWNYFDPGGPPAFRSSAAYARIPEFTATFKVAQPAVFHLGGLVLGRPRAPGLAVAIDDGPERTVASAAAVWGFKTVDFGSFRLAQGEHQLHTRAVCPDRSQCDLELFALSLVPSDLIGPRELPQLKVLNDGRSSIEAEAETSGEGLILLRDSFDSGWRATAYNETDPGGRTLRHVRAQGFANGWLLPPGHWRVVIEFSPQHLYRRSIVFTLVGVLLILFASLLLQVRRSRSGGRG